MKDTKIALIQICPRPGDPVKNAGKIMERLKQAKQEGASLAVFPECSLTGYRTANPEQLALFTEDGILAGIRSCSRALGIAVCFGYIQKTEDKLYITQELASDGESVLYHKTHPGTREKGVFAAGCEFPVTDSPLRTGMQLCWESHIPEISSLERKRGAELLLIPYASPMSGERCRENWSVHLPARASDNGVFAAAANLLFEEENTGGMRGGGLAVYDPKGKRIAEYFGSDEHMITCELKGPLPRELPEGDMHTISYFDRKREELFG